MAESQSKRSVHRAQHAHRASTTKVFHFPQAKGKILQGVEFDTSSGYHAITVNFQDNTCLDLVIDTCFTLKADYFDWRSGEQRVLKQWPAIRSIGNR